jgi:hypothetical protein
MTESVLKPGAHTLSRVTLGTVLVLLLVGWPVEGQEARPAVVPQEEAESERLNELALVIAGSSDLEEDETFFTLGVEYERRITARVGIIAEVEYLFDADRWIAAVPVVFRPARGVKLFAGPGFERADDDEGDEEVGEEPIDGRAEGSATSFLFRIGGGYTFELEGRYSISPTLSLDFVREEGTWARALVFGVSVGIGF